MFQALVLFLSFHPELWPMPPAQFETTQSYTVEDWNDDEFAAYSPPPPVHEVAYDFDVASSPHEEAITVSSKTLRNLSITLENTGTGCIKAPHLFGPHGWDFRSLKAIAEAVTNDASLTPAEKFIRIHEWKGLHVMTVLGGSYAPYNDKDFSSNPLRVLNQYGHAMCGQSTSTVNALLRMVPPAGSMYGRKAKISAHRTGEAFWDGGWHAYDATPGTGVVQWVYYDADNENIAPSWKYLLANTGLLARTKAWSGFTLAEYPGLSQATGETFAENAADTHWDFNYDLRPGESLTMHFDMRGRLDRTSARQDNSRSYRCYSDYGSAVFTYKPDFTNGLYGKYAASQENIRQTATGIIPVNPTVPASIVFALRSTWCFAGADITARFRTGGKVYIAVNEDPYDTKLPERPDWQLLSASRKEYEDAAIEGKMVYWVKCEFQGSGSGLTALEISSEAQMSPWSMPGLEYGTNRIRFEADGMDGSSLHVSYRYDDKSPFHRYDPATSNYGRLIPVRVGGVLQQGAKTGADDYRKGRFWQRLAQTPNEKVNVRLEIFQVSGPGAGSRVRTLVNEPLRYGWYTFYWDGTDGDGHRMPVGMYCYKMSIKGAVVHGERLYLYSEIWPMPNERLSSPPPLAEELAAAAVPASAEPEPPAPPAPPTVEETPEAEVPPPEPIKLSLSLRAVSGTVRFNVPRIGGRSRPDSCQVSGELPGLPAGWNPDGKELVIDVGGVEERFTLGRRGRAKSGAGSVQLRLRRKGHEFQGGPVSFRLRLKGDLANEWIDEGIDPGADEKDAPLNLAIELALDGATYAAEVKAILDSTAGRRATFSFRR